MEIPNEFRASGPIVLESFGSPVLCPHGKKGFPSFPPSHSLDDLSMGSLNKGMSARSTSEYRKETKHKIKSLDPRGGCAEDFCKAIRRRRWRQHPSKGKNRGSHFPRGFSFGGGGGLNLNPRSNTGYNRDEGWEQNGIVAVMIPQFSSEGEGQRRNTTANRKFAKGHDTGSHSLSHPAEKGLEPKCFASTSLRDPSTSNMVLSDIQCLPVSPLRTASDGRKRKVWVEDDEAGAGVEEEEDGDKDEEDDNEEDKDTFQGEVYVDSYENLHDPWEASGSFTVGSFALSPNHSSNFLVREHQETTTASSRGAGGGHHPRSCKEHSLGNGGGGRSSLASSLPLKRCVAMKLVSKPHAPSESFLFGSPTTTSLSRHGSPTGLDHGNKAQHLYSPTISSPSTTSCGAAGAPICSTAASSDVRSKEVSHRFPLKDDPLHCDDHIRRGQKERKEGRMASMRENSRRKEEDEDVNDEKVESSCKGEKELPKLPEGASGVEMIEILFSECPLDPLGSPSPSPFSPPPPGGIDASGASPSTIPSTVKTITGSFGLRKNFFPDVSRKENEKASSLPALSLLEEENDDGTEMNSPLYTREEGEWYAQMDGKVCNGAEQWNLRVVPCSPLGQMGGGEISKSGSLFSWRGGSGGGGRRTRGGELGHGGVAHGRKTIQTISFPSTSLIGAGGSGRGEGGVGSPNGMEVREEGGPRLSKNPHRGRKENMGEGSAPAFYVSYSGSFNNSWEDRRTSKRVRHHRVIQERREREAVVSAELQESCAEIGTFLHHHFDGVAEAAAELGMKVVTLPQMGASSLESWNPAHSVEAQSPCMDDYSHFPFPMDSNSTSQLSCSPGTPKAHGAGSCKATPQKAELGAGPFGSSGDDFGGKGGSFHKREESLTQEGRNPVEEGKEEDQGLSSWVVPAPVTVHPAESKGDRAETRSLILTSVTPLSPPPTAPSAFSFMALPTTSKTTTHTLPESFSTRGDRGTREKKGVNAPDTICLEEPLYAAHTGVYKDAVSGDESESTNSFLYTHSSFGPLPLCSSGPFPPPVFHEEESEKEEKKVQRKFLFTASEGNDTLMNGEMREAESKERAKTEEKGSTGSVPGVKLMEKMERDNAYTSSSSSPISFPLLAKEKAGHTAVKWSMHPEEEVEDGMPESLNSSSSLRLTPLPGGTPGAFLPSSASPLPSLYHEDAELRPPSVRHRYGSTVSYGSTVGGGVGGGGGTPCLRKEEEEEEGGHSVHSPGRLSSSNH